MVSTSRLLCVGDLNADVTITTPDGITPGSDTVGSVRLSGGGSAANVAAWASKAGAATRFVGVVGDDALGDFLVGDLSARGVQTSVLRRGESRSIAAIVEADADRSLVSDLSTTSVMTADDVDAAWFDGITWLHLTGYTYFPDGGPETMALLLELAAKRNIPCSVDPSSAQMLRTECDRADVLSVFADAAMLFPSTDEAEYLSGDADPARAAGALLDVVERVAVTDGERGAWLAVRGSDVIHVPARRDAVVNALGCGDAFAGGYLAGVQAGLDPPVCASLAIDYASRALARSTAR